MKPCANAATPILSCSRSRPPAGSGSRSGTRGLLTDTRGAVFAEGLIILPVLFVVWASVSWVHKHADRKLVAMEEARTCVWSHATGGCERPAPPGCALFAEPKLSDEDLAGSRAALANLKERLLSFQTSLEDYYGAVFRPVVETHPVLTIEKPELLGGGEQQVRFGFAGTCGDSPSNLGVNELSSDVFCRLSGWCGP